MYGTGCMWSHPDARTSTARPPPPLEVLSLRGGYFSSKLLLDGPTFTPNARQVQ